MSKKIPGTPPPVGTIALAVPPLHTNAKRKVLPPAAHDETSGKAVLPLLCPDPRDWQWTPQQRQTHTRPALGKLVCLFIRNFQPRPGDYWNWIRKLQFMLRKQKIELLGSGQGWHLEDPALKLPKDSCCNPSIRPAGWFSRLQNLSNAGK